MAKQQRLRSLSDSAMATRSKGSAAFKRPGKRGGKGKHKRGDDAAAAKPRGNAAEQLQEQVARLEALGVETRPPPEVDEATDERRCKVWCAEEEAERIVSIALRALRGACAGRLPSSHGILTSPHAAARARCGRRHRGP